MCRIYFRFYIGRLRTWINLNCLPTMVRKIPTTVSTSCDNSTTGRVDNVEPFSSMARDDGNLNNNKNLSVQLVVLLLNLCLKYWNWEFGTAETELFQTVRSRQKLETYLENNTKFRNLVYVDWRLHMRIQLTHNISISIDAEIF